MFCEQLESRRMLFAAHTYFVSPTGNDNNTGLSMAVAWKSIDRVNAAGLKPGDKILFESGKTFNGNIYVGSREQGETARPILFSSTGDTRAIIKSSGNGFEATGGRSVTIKNLNFVGPGSTGNQKNGIYFHHSRKNQLVSHIKISSVDVSNYGFWGIKIEGGGNSSTGAGYNDVSTVFADLHDNGYGGYGITAMKHNLNTNIYVGNTKTFNNLGVPGFGGVSGHGIFIADVDKATVEYSVAHDNGIKGQAPVGIWAAGSKNVLIQHCESYNNKSKSGTDGGGFDLDVDVSSSVMQYNYSHDNYGPGYAMAQVATSTYYGGNTIRFNISQNDGRKNGRGAIHFWGKILDAQVYNNTVFMTPAGSGDSAALRAHNVGAGRDTEPKNVSVRNNIFYTTGGVKMTNITSAVAAGFSLQGNDYFSAGGAALNINFAGKNYTSLSSFISATGQEKSNGATVGMNVDPQLTNPGKGGNFGDATLLKNLSAYTLKSTSPLINKGMNPVSGVALSSVNTDFYGDAVPRGGKYDLGADEV